MDLSTSINQIPRVGLFLQKKLKDLGIKTVKDLLYHLPQRYEDFSNLTTVVNLQPRQSVSLSGKILEIKNSFAWTRKITITQAIFQDQTGALKLLWFRKPYIPDILKPGDRVMISGKVSQGKKGIYLAEPTYEKIDAKEDEPPFGRLGDKAICGFALPIYPETQGLSSKWLRSIIKNTFLAVKGQIKEFLPPEILKDFSFLPLAKALFQIHVPESLEAAQKARARLAFEEIFIIELFVIGERIKNLQTPAPPILLNLELIQKFVKSLPFKLTDAQRKSSWQILKDLEKPHPMNRLLEGEVGSGKTVVAAMAALNTVKAGFQATIMAPTEILAKQHFKEVAKLLFAFKPTIALLTGKEDKIMAKKLKGEIMEASRQKILKKCLEGEIDILIGTHALIQKGVKFKNLGLAIVDEQHRFGIEQRARLCKEGSAGVPHLLSMTATPIPRSLALTIYGDLDISIIDELPKGRQKIITKVAPPKERDRVYDFIKAQVEIGRQAFVICPRIEVQSEKSKAKNAKFSSWNDVKAVSEEKEKLEKKIFPDLKVAMLHGRMKPKEKEKIMKDFRNNKTNLLVATSVVEVGIDIANATVMVIEGADRFGLAQLHQLRGRVGRGQFQSYCFLFTDSSAQKTKMRLEAIVKSQDGFELSQKDLEIRGPGQLSGNKQWGLPDIAMASLKDFQLVATVKEAAKKILTEDMRLRKYPLLKERLKRFKEKAHLE